MLLGKWNLFCDKGMFSPICSIFIRLGIELFNYLLYCRPGRQVDRYIALMEKLTKAVAFFKENNPDSPELNTVVCAKKYFVSRAFRLLDI